MVNPSFDPYRVWLGIDTAQQPVDHYRLLGIARFETNQSAIRHAAARQAAIARSHLSGPHSGPARQLLDEIVAAQTCLLDPHAKSQYDGTLHGQVGGSAPYHVPMGPPVAVRPPSKPPSAISVRPAPTVPSESGMPSESDTPAAILPEGPVTAVAESPPPAEHQAAEDETADPAEAAGQPFYRRTWFLLLLAACAAIGISGGGGVGLWLISDSQPETAGDESETPPVAADGNQADGAPPIEPALPEIPVVQPGAGGEILLAAESADRHGPNLNLQQSGSRSVLAGWHSAEDDSATWKFRAEYSGIYDVKVTYSVNEPGGRYQISVSGAANSASSKVRSAATAGEPVTDSLKLVLRTPGEMTLTLRPTEIPGNELMVLESIRLIPRNRR